MTTPYSENYKKRMQEYFSKRENKPEERPITALEKTRAKSIEKSVVYEKTEFAPKIAKKKKNILNIGLLTLFAILFILFSFYLLYIIPENPVLLGIVLGFCVMAVFLFLFLFHKTYERLIENISVTAIFTVVFLLLIINMILSAYGFYAVEWAFLGFIVAGVIFYDSKIDSRFLIFFALILLGYIPFLMIAKQNAFAETIAIYVYYFLVVGVGMQIAENLRPQDESLDFETVIKSIMNAKYLGEYMIGIGLMSIVLIIISRFMEIEVLKWTAVYVFVIVFIFYAMAMLENKEKWL